MTSPSASLRRSSRPLWRVGECEVVESQKVEDGRGQVVDVMPLLGRSESEVVGRADDRATLHTAARHPDAEAEGAVVTPVLALGHRRAAELAGPK